MTIGERIREARRAKGLTQKELACRAEMAEVSIGQYEREKRQPTISQLRRISNALGVPLDDLLGIADTKHPIGPAVMKEVEHVEVIQRRIDRLYQLCTPGQLSDILDIIDVILRLPGSKHQEVYQFVRFMASQHDGDGDGRGDPC